MKIECPDCGKLQNIPDVYINKKTVKCLKCKAEIPVTPSKSSFPKKSVLTGFAVFFGLLVLIIIFTVAIPKKSANVKLQTIIKNQKGERTLQEQLQTAKAKTVFKGGIKAIKEPVYGIYLGEKLDELRKRFRISRFNIASQDADDPSECWDVHYDFDAISFLTVSTIEGRVWTIDVGLKDSSRENFNAIKSVLREKYPIEEDTGSNIEEAWSIYSKSPNLTFHTTLNGVQVYIYLSLKTSFMEDDSTLSLSYTHMPLAENRQKEIERRKAAKIEDAL